MTDIKNIFDTHAHYNDEKFKENKDEIISYVNKNGVDYICNIGANIKTSEESIELSKKYNFIYSSVGIHPFHSNELEKGWEETFKKLAEEKKVVAIGEAGLDYSQEEFPREKQFEIFEKQLDIAQNLDMPFIIHSRDAAFDTLSIVKNFPKVKGVVHCFSYDFNMAEKYIDMGWYIGFTGIVTFKNAKKTVKVAENIPLERIVVETDCPYMAPEPFRGSVCDSSMLKSVIKKIAEIKKMDPQEIATKTKENAFSLYKIKNKIKF